MNITENLEKACRDLQANIDFFGAKLDKDRALLAELQSLIEKSKNGLAECRPSIRPMVTVVSASKHGDTGAPAIQQPKKSRKRSGPRSQLDRNQLLHLDYKVLRRIRELQERGTPATATAINKLIGESPCRIRNRVNKLVDFGMVSKPKSRGPLSDGYKLTPSGVAQAHGDLKSFAKSMSATA